jgi:hypothetical protein
LSKKLGKKKQEKWDKEIIDGCSAVQNKREGKYKCRKKLGKKKQETAEGTRRVQCRRMGSSWCTVLSFAERRATYSTSLSSRLIDIMGSQSCWRSLAVSLVGLHCASQRRAQDLSLESFGSFAQTKISWCVPSAVDLMCDTVYRKGSRARKPSDNWFVKVLANNKLSEGSDVSQRDQRDLGIKLLLMESKPESLWNKRCPL